MISSHAIYSALLAGGLALLELFNASRKPPAIRAVGWILVLFGFDGGSALAIYALLKVLFDGLSWFTGLWPIILAGFSGPALLRSQLSLLGSGQESTYYGPANRYRRVQRGIEKKIDQLGAAAQSNWVSKKLSFIQEIDMDDFELRVTTFLNSLGESFGDQEREQLLKYVNDTLSAEDIEDKDKRRAIMQKLLNGGCRECVKGLVRAGKNMKKSRGELSLLGQQARDNSWWGRSRALFRSKRKSDDKASSLTVDPNLCECGHTHESRDESGVSYSQWCLVCDCEIFRRLPP